MTTEHTAGPWKVMENAKGNFQHGISTANGAPVSAMIAYVDIKSVNTDKTARLANARLMAAAPELLAAMRDCLADLEHYAATHGPGPDRRLIAYRAAIAKAEGKA